MSQPPSKSQVEKAGKIVRRYYRAEEVDQVTYFDAIGTIERHRAAHAQPMLTANMALRRLCEQLQIDGRVTQRLKRMDTIMEKLADRHHGMNLARMQDIGGCRVVVGSVDELRALETAFVAKRRDDLVREPDDYVLRPRDSGYRAVHLVAEFGSELRKPVEIQLRTHYMHEWADTVESVSGALGINYKRDGHSAFQEWARGYSEFLAVIEAGDRPSETQIAALELLLARVESDWNPRSTP